MRNRLLIIFILFSSNLSFAQLVSLQGDSLSFDNVVTTLESQTKLKFYYDSKWVKDLSLNADFKSEPVKSIIEWLCSKSKLTFSTINQNKVIFLKDSKIKTNYAQSYSKYLDRQEAFKNDTVVYYLPKKDTKKESNINEEFLLFAIGNKSNGSKLKHASLSGKIKDIETGEALVGAVAYVAELKNGATSNSYGFYSLSLPKGRYKVEFRSVGMKTTYRNIIIHSDGELNIEMKSKATSLKEIVVTSKNDDPIRNLRMGVEKISMKTMKQLPLGMGEPDVIKSTLLLPGVQSVGEASSGFNVRGGNIDQNLILLNDAPIINPSHFFGFFSGFNSEIVKDITLYKSGVPAKYGGRVSSVLDITIKDGNRKNLKVNGGISPVFSRLMIESPIKKDKSSFIIAARTTYSDWVLKLMDDNKLKKSKAAFYDLQGSLSFDLNQNNSLYISGYTSHDNFDYYSENAFTYNTLASTVKWKHIFSPKLFSTFSGVISNYDYLLKSRTDSSSLHSIEYALNQYSFKSDFSYHSSLNHKIDFGLSTIWYNLLPGIRKPISEKSLIARMEIEKEQALETALYVSDEFDLGNFISLSIGLRYSFYSSFGPKTQFNYQPGLSKNITSISDTVFYEKGSPVSNYSGPEFRFSSNIRVGNSSSIKLGFNRMYQYIQMISNTAAMSPTDIWKLSDNYLKPLIGDQYSLGFYTKHRQNTLETSIETYYKSLNDIIDYKDGAQLVMNEQLETAVLNGYGMAYGVEFMIQKKTGKLTGWFNYTYSRIFHKINSFSEEEQVNNGDYFPANYDKPHDFKFIANYKISRRINFSFNFFYSTGRPFTAPVSYYTINGAKRVYYTERNSLRMPDYMRFDLAATINGNLKAKKANHSSWTFAVYNIFGRRNAYNIFFRTEDEQVKGYKMSIFGQPIFTITYNFRIFGNAKDDF